MLINDLLDLLMRVPPTLASAWAVWFGVGLVLSIWQRREKARLVVHGPSARTKSGVRPPAGVRPPSGMKIPVAERPARPVKARMPAPNNVDPFSELEALLEAPVGSHRTPGESPLP